MLAGEHTYYITGICKNQRLFVFYIKNFRTFLHPGCEICGILGFAEKFFEEVIP